MPKLYYKDINPSGEKAVVLLHGLGATCDSWQMQFAPLEAAGYRIIAPDFVGFGQTDYDGEQLNIKAMSEDIYELLKVLNIQKASLVGLSMGGAVALQFALDHPVIIDKLVVSNTASCFMSRKGGFWYFLPRFILFNITPAIVKARFISWIVFPYEHQAEFRAEFIKQVLQSHPKAYLRTAKSLLKFDLRDAIHRIKAPTLVIGGREDSTTPLYLQEFIHNEIKSSKMVVLDGGHVTSIDSAEGYNEAVLEFLGTKN